MPSSVITSSTSAPWRDGATLSAACSLPWRDGAVLVSTGSPFVAPAPPPGGVGGPPVLTPDFILPAAVTYPLTHTVTAIDLRDGTAVAFDSMSFHTDDGSVCWTLSATGPAALFARFTTGTDLPVVSVMVDGVEWRFIIEGVSRSRQFANTGVTVTGRSITISAGEPYTFASNWINEGPATAAQICDQAQLYTQLVVDWQLDDWLVPDKVWSFSGTPLAVVKRVAESVAAVVRSERAEFRLSVMPRYRVLPNEWGAVPPDCEIHIDAAMTDSYQRADQPAYNGVYVSGQQQGAVGHVYLQGTAGDLLAPLVTDLLLTDIDAVRQRGQAILGASGPQASVQMTLPVLTGAGKPGVLELGWLCSVVGDGATWYGVVRAVSVAVKLPSVLQTVTLERHTAFIAGTVVTE